MLGVRDCVNCPAAGWQILVIGLVLFLLHSMGRSLELCFSFQPSLGTSPSAVLLPGRRRSWAWSVSLPHSSPSASLSPHSSSSSSSLASNGSDHHHYLVGKVCVEMAMPGASFWLDRHCLAQLFYHWTHSTHANTLNTCKHKSLSLFLRPCLSVVLFNV